MLNPNMFDAMNNQNIPTVKELWKDEKTKYRHWILLFGIGILIVFSLYVTSFVINQLAKKDIIENLEELYLKNLKPNAAFEESQKRWNSKYLIIPIVIISMMAIGLLYYVTTVINSYQKKSFSRISQWSTFVIGLGAVISFYQLFSQIWIKNNVTFTTPGTIFEFINHFIIIIVYFLVSVKVVRIRKQFQISERFEMMKNNPNYQSTINQVQQMMQGKNFTQTNQGTFGPNLKNQSSSQNIKTNQDNKSKVTIELEAMSLDDLKIIAKNLSISGYKNMKKDDLIKAILRVTS